MKNSKVQIYKGNFLPIPFDAQIREDPTLRERLKAHLSEKYNELRPEIHVSDLVFCLRKSAFQKLNPKPVDDQSLSFFTAGRGHHDILEGLHGAEKEKEIRYEGVVGHIDIFENEPIEIKTTRSFQREVKRHWILQLGYYCAMLNKNEGKLIILYLFPKKQPEKEKDGFLIETYSIHFNDLEIIRKDLLQRRDQLIKALEKKDPMSAPKTEEEWLCRACPYREECGGEK